MLNILRQNPTDVIFLIESTAFTNVCFEQIKLKFINPLMQFFYSGSINEDLGVSNDYSGVIFSAVSYKSLDAFSNSICSLIQPTSHPKRFLDKLDTLIDFRSGLNDDHTHLAEGLALAFDLFEEISNRRKHIQANRHLILISRLDPYDDIPIIENLRYKGKFLDDMLQLYQQEQIEFSLISTKHSNSNIKIYETINHAKTQPRIDTFDNFTFFSLIHGSVVFNPQQIIEQKISEEISYAEAPNSVQISSPFSNQASIIQPPIQPSVPSPMMQPQQSTSVPPNSYPILSPRQPASIQTQQIQDDTTTNSYNPSQPPHIQPINVSSPQQLPPNQPIISQSSIMPQRIPQMIRQPVVNSRPPVQPTQQPVSSQNLSFNQIRAQQTPVQQISPYGIQPQLQQQRQLIWQGIFEWSEKDRQNPANKILHSCKANAFSTVVINPQTGQNEPEIPVHLAQQWATKLSLQIFSTYILTLPGASFEPNAKKVYFLTENSNNINELKNSLSAPNIGGGLISIPNTEMKLLILQVINNEIVGRVPQDAPKFLVTLKQFIAQTNAAKQQQQLRQRQMNMHPQQMQDASQQQQPQQMMNPQQPQQNWSQQPNMYMSQSQQQQQQQYMDMYPQ